MARRGANVGVVRSPTCGFERRGRTSQEPVDHGAVVLVETGFMSNRREAALLRSAGYQQRLAGALARATRRFVRP